MALAVEQLPNDVGILRRLLLERDAEAMHWQATAQTTRVEFEVQRAELEVQRNEVVLSRLMIEKLKLQIARMKRVRFSASSEKLDTEIVQLELIVEDLESTL